MSRNGQKVWKAQVAAKFLLEQLQSPETAANPMELMTCLYVLKSSFEKSPMPKVAEVYFEQNILPTLVEILGKEFRPQGDENKVAIYCLAMEIIWLFSSMDKPYITSLLFEPLINVLIKYMDISNRFYQFSPLFTRKLTSLCQNTRFVQQRVNTVPVTREIWNDIVFYKPCMSLYGKVTELYECCLNIRLEGKTEVYSIAKRLINDRLAWSKLRKESQGPVIKSVAEVVHPVDYRTSRERSVLVDEDSEPDGIRKDVLVLDVIGGHYFWAYVGSEAMHTVQSISDLLQKEIPSLTPCHPTVGSLVAVVEDEAESTDSDWPNVMRGRVIQAGADEVQVFAIDYGLIRNVKSHQIRQLSGSTQCLTKFDAQAKVCCLAGVQAPPAEVSAVELAVCAFTNLTKFFVNPGFMLSSAGGMDHLYRLVKCGPPNIQLQAVRLLSNVTSISRISKTQDWTQFIRPLLGVLTGNAIPETLARLAKKEVLDNISRNMIVASLYALTNIMYRKAAYHGVFFELQGHIIVMNLMRLFKCSVPIMRAAAGMLRAAFPGLMKSVPDKPGLYRPDRKSDTGEEGEDEEEERLLGSRKENQLDKEEFSDEEISNLMEQLLQKQQSMVSCEEEVSNADGSSADTKGGGQTEQSVPEPSETVSGGVGGGSDEAADRGRSSVKLVPVDGGSVYKGKQSVYVYNTYLPYNDDATHHLLDVEDVASISINKLSELVCGMINSRGGTIYIGLTKQGCVRGVKLNRTDRDSVRLGIDDIMTRCTPTIAFTLLQAEYMQVMMEVNKGEMMLCKDLFVIEIIARAPQEPEYYLLGNKPPVCYQRYGPNTHQLSNTDVCQIVALEEMSKYQPQVDELRRNIQELLND